MTRAMLVTVLWRMDGKPAAAGGSSFTDVPRGQWYTEAVAWAAENGVVNGVGGGKFEPDGNVTREQIATILYRYAGLRGVPRGGTDRRNARGRGGLPCAAAERHARAGRRHPDALPRRGISRKTPGGGPKKSAARLICGDRKNPDSYHALYCKFPFAVLQEAISNLRILPHSFSVYR